MVQPVVKNLSNARFAAREARRQQLIDATIDSISKRGFSGTTLATVTASVKLSHGTVNYHFDSKETLYVETLGYLAEEPAYRAEHRKQSSGRSAGRWEAAERWGRRLALLPSAHIQ